MGKGIDEYISKGFDRRAAEYFAAGRRRVVGVTPNVDYTLTLDFDNGERRSLDMRPMIKEGTVFAFLSDTRNFARAYVDDMHCVAWDINPSVDSKTVWSNKIDLSPDTCYMDSVPLDGDTDV